MWEGVLKMTKKFEVLGKERIGTNKEGEGRCITYSVVTSHIFATHAKEAEDIFIELHPECDEVLHRETKEIPMTPKEINEYAREVK
jgi:quinolinate synthase